MGSRDRPTPLDTLADFGDDADATDELGGLDRAPILPDYDDDPATESLDGSSAGLDLPANLQVVRVLEPTQVADRLEALDMDIGRGNVLHVALPDRMEAFARWRERRVRLDHPAIPQVLQSGTLVDGRPFLAITPDIGVPIWAWATHAEPVERVLALMDACLAIHSAHQHGLGHGAIGPNTILVDTPRQVKVVGWNLGPIEDDVAALASLGLDLVDGDPNSRVARTLRRFQGQTKGNARALYEGLLDSLRLG